MGQFPAAAAGNFYLSILIINQSPTFLHFAFSMSRILLLDLDHTLYPSTLPTGEAVDARIAQYLCNHLKLSWNEADALRQQLSARYGTTLKGMEILHGVDRERYCDFIQDLEDHLMPPPNPLLREWLIAAGEKMPAYLFTNARRDWVDRCLASMGFDDLLPENPGGKFSGVLQGILDIGFMEWIGKPEAEAFSKVESYLKDRHASFTEIIFADDRLDNLEQARLHGWTTVWVRPHDATVADGDDPANNHRIVDSLLELDPETL